jgi:deoxyribose-phosphate aldolase
VDLDQPSTVASLIDHTLLKPEASESAIARLCEEAREHSFASVCVNPSWVPVATKKLAGSQVKVCTVIGFPLGANQTETKLFEADLALSQGATELDAVQNIGALRSGALDMVRRELGRLAELAHSRGALLKVILETCLLSDQEKRIACKLAVEARADFVKTSTGFSTSGANSEDLMLMRETVGSGMGVKASGGIRSLATLKTMVSAGANRIGTSSGVQILKELAHETQSEAIDVEEKAVTGGQPGHY